MPKLRHKTKPMDEQMFVRMTERMAVRVRRQADVEGMKLGEWIRLAIVDKLNRAEVAGHGV